MNVIKYSHQKMTFLNVDYSPFFTSRVWLVSLVNGSMIESKMYLLDKIDDLSDRHRIQTDTILPYCFLISLVSMLSRSYYRVIARI